MSRSLAHGDTLAVCWAVDGRCVGYRLHDEVGPLVQGRGVRGLSEAGPLGRDSREEEGVPLPHAQDGRVEAGRAPRQRESPALGPATVPPATAVLETVLLPAVTARHQDPSPQLGRGDPRPEPRRHSLHNNNNNAHNYHTRGEKKEWLIYPEIGLLHQ